MKYRGKESLVYFKAQRVVFFSSCTEITGSICVFCNAHFFLFMHRPSVFSVQVKQHSEQHICIESCSKYQRLSYLWFEINMIWTKYL